MDHELLVVSLSRESFVTQPSSSYGKGIEKLPRWENIFINLEIIQKKNIISVFLYFCVDIAVQWSAPLSSPCAGCSSRSAVGMQPPPETAELGRAVLGWEAAAVVLLLAALLPTLAAETFPDASKPHFKPYSGFRVSEVSLLRVVAHDQTVGVIELARGAETRLLSCELIEVS